MQKKLALAITLLAFPLAVISCSRPKVSTQTETAAGDKIHFPQEKHLKNIRQLTQGGTNAEAYWSFDGKHLSFQAKGPKGSPGPACDQIYTMRADGSEKTRISLADARTTCSYYFPTNERILYSSTISGGAGCPQAPDMSKGYVWPIYDSFRMYSSKPDGTDTFEMEPGAPRAYTAEATLCHDGSLVFTSDRSGDLELYTAKLDPMGTISGIKQVTHTLGYDGGAFFSPDCKRLVWRASRPKKGKETKEYLELLKKHLVRPTELEIYVGNADGTHVQQVTKLGAASFAPFFTPDGNAILFASNFRKPGGRNFDIYKINVNGSGLERITWSDTFESFPMFSPDGKQLAFSSNRNAAEPHETNVFVADWVDGPEAQGETITSATDRIHALDEKLASPDMEGRGLGTAGLKKAEALIASEFTSLGLKPYLSETNFHPVETKLGKAEKEKTYSSNNVLGAFGCESNASRKTPLVIGAHLDHLGYGGDGSLEASTGKIHPGADDNASGVATIVEIARTLTQAPKKPASCVVFAAFTAEESGIIGSSRLVEEFKSKGIHPKAMLNLDMVGRMQGNQLLVFGTDTAREWKDLIDKECIASHLDCKGGGDGYGPSDQMAFYIAGAPVLHFFTGPHADHHRSTDTSDKINATGAAQVADIVAAVALKAADPHFTLHFKRGKPVPEQLIGRAAGDGKSTGAYLGTIPDYSDLSTVHGGTTTGVKLSGVREGSPAEKAGIKAGDVLTAIIFEEAAGGKDTSHSLAISNLEDFSATLKKLSPGMKISLKIRRAAEELKLPATVGKRGD